MRGSAVSHFKSFTQKCVFIYSLPLQIIHTFARATMQRYHQQLYDCMSAYALLPTGSILSSSKLGKLQTFWDEIWLWVRRPWLTHQNKQNGLPGRSTNQGFEAPGFWRKRSSETNAHQCAAQGFLNRNQCLRFAQRVASLMRESSVWVHAPSCE